MLTLAPVSLLPLGDARVERLVLLAADQLGVDGDALELAGQVGGKGSACSRMQATMRRRTRRKAVCSLVSSLGAPQSPTAISSDDKKCYIHIQTKHSWIRQARNSFPPSRFHAYMKIEIHWRDGPWMTDEDERYRAPALDKGLDILELLAGVDGGLTQAEIAKKLDRSPNEFYRMLDRLVRRGYVTRHRRRPLLADAEAVRPGAVARAGAAAGFLRHAADARARRNLAAGQPARRLRSRLRRRHRAAGGAELLGHLDPRRLAHQPVRHRLRPCAARLPLAGRAADDDFRTRPQHRQAAAVGRSSSPASTRSATAATR